MIIKPTRRSRSTFKNAVKIAEGLGFVLERYKGKNGGYEYWKKNNCHTTGWSETLTEAIADILTW